MVQFCMRNGFPSLSGSSPGLLVLDRLGVLEQRFFRPWRSFVWIGDFLEGGINCWKSYDYLVALRFYMFTIRLCLVPWGIPDKFRCFSPIIVYFPCIICFGRDWGWRWEGIRSKSGVASWPDDGSASLASLWFPNWQFGWSKATASFCCMIEKHDFFTFRREGKSSSA